MQHIKNFIRTIKRKAIEYGIVAAVVVTITAYAYQPVSNVYEKIVDAFTPKEYVASASTTEPVIIDSFEAEIITQMESKEGQEMLRAWATERVARGYKVRMAEIEEKAARTVSGKE